MRAAVVVARQGQRGGQEGAIVIVVVDADADVDGWVLDGDDDED